MPVAGLATVVVVTGSVEDDEVEVVVVLLGTVVPELGTVVVVPVGGWLDGDVEGGRVVDVVG